jgi:hypothetical protein
VNGDFETDFESQAGDFIRSRAEISDERSPFGSAILLAGARRTAFNLLPTGRFALKPDALTELSESCRRRGILLVNLREDIWRYRNAQAKSSILSKLGLTETLHARKTEVSRISKPELDAFMNENHLMGSALCKYKYGLKIDGATVAAAAFAPFRKYIRNGATVRSSELVRFANLNGFTVAGGLSRLIAAFVNDRHPDDIMSYADRDWSDGAAYRRTGFAEAGSTPPAALLFDGERGVLRSLRPDENPLDATYNTGNMKFILTLDKQRNKQQHT